jgi:tape measure domain-containing protein
VSGEELELGVKFREDASRNAPRAAKGIEAIADNARKAQKELAKLERVSAERLARNREISERYAVQKRYRDIADARRKAAQKAYDDNKFSTKRMLGLDEGPTGQDLEGVVKTGLVGVAVGAGVAAVAVGKLTYEIVQGTTAAMRFSDAATTGLTLITGDAQKANQVFDDAVKLSDRLGTSWQTSVSGMQKLLGKGFSKAGAEDLVKATSDLSVVAPDANIDNLLLAIGQIKTAGKLQGDELNQLTEAGLNSELMFQALEKRLGKTRAEILKMKEAGQLMAEPVLESIKDSVKALTGKELGKASEDASKTLAGIFRRVEGLPERFFLDVAKKADKSGLTETLAGLWESVGPGSPGFDAAVDGAVRVFDLVVEGAKTALPLVKEFMGGVVDGFADIQGADTSGELFAQWRDPQFIAMVGKLGENLGTIAGATVRIGEAVAEWWPTIAKLGEASLWLNPLTVVPKAGFELFDFLTGTDERFAVEGQNIGKSLGQGIVAGMNSSLPGVDAASRQLGNTALNATRDVTETHSPSRKMMEIGWDQGAGFALGMGDSSSLVNRAANDMGAVALRTAASDLPTVTSGSAVTNNNSSSVRMGAPVFHLTIQGNADANTVQELERMVDRQIERFFDRAALQGAAA